MDGVTLVWAWPNHGGRWHLLADGADLALCGVGKRGWMQRAGGLFDQTYLTAFACLPCLAAERKRAATPLPTAGAGGGAR